MVNPNNYTYYYDNTVVVGVYALKSGTWTKVQDYTVYPSDGAFTTGGSRTYTWAVNDNFQLGSGVSAFGLSITSVTLGTATISSFTHAKWQATGSTGGTRTASPNGEQATITVRPV